MIKREKKYDILKSIGIFCIILAHVNPPSILFQLRNFDVVLMMMISASLFFNKYNDYFNVREYIVYIKKRFKRLVIPTWIFLTFYFFIIYIIDRNYLSLNKLLSTYTLHGGIGYVWIIRIYLIETVLLPFIYYLIKRIKLKYVIVLIGILYVIYEVLCHLNLFNYSIILNDYVAYMFPTTLIILITYIVNKVIYVKGNFKKQILISIICLIIFCLLCMYYYKTTGSFHTTNYRKYPFRLYYLSYAISMSTLLFCFVSLITTKQIIFNKFISFIGKSSLWIYLWHILFIKIFSLIEINWFINYLLIIICSFITTLIQNRIIDYMEQKGKKRLSIFEFLRG